MTCSGHKIHVNVFQAVSTILQSRGLIPLPALSLHWVPMSDLLNWIQCMLWRHIMILFLLANVGARSDHLSTLAISESACCHDAAFCTDRRCSLLRTRNNPGLSWNAPSEAAQHGLHPCPSLAHFIPSPNVGCLGLKQLTAGRRAPCSSRHLSLLTPCCPACQSAQPPPRGKQRLYKPELTLW